MPNQEQLAILRQGVDVWNTWRANNATINVDLSEATLEGINLAHVHLWAANLRGTKLSNAICSGANLILTNLSQADLQGTNLLEANLIEADLNEANLRWADLRVADLRGVHIHGSNFSKAEIGGTVFGNLDLSNAKGLDDVVHRNPSNISIDVFAKSKGKISKGFLRGCGLSDWEIESVKLYNPDLSSEDFIDIQNRIFDLRNRQAIQISPLFISYSHSDGAFVDKLETHLNKKGVRFWRDVHDMKSGRMETQVDRAIRQNPTVLLILSEHALQSDWVEHEVRTARGLEKEMGRDVLCPVALDASWKDSPWPRRVMEQVMEYNILDFSAWEDDGKFGNTFNKLIDGLQLFYKG
jgi:uncharacterized protein YjbI with pentapeptide repeats